MYHTTNETINLLIVDDKADNIAALEMSLEGQGLTIFSSTNPKNAIQLCIEKDISIALIDVMMPEIDGWELLDLIKENRLTAHILAILITGHSMTSEHVVRGLKSGAVDFLFKPLDLYITIAKVNSLKMLVSHQREITRKNVMLENYQKELFKAIEIIENKKAGKENFLANMSHEIRTPLNAISGLTHLLKLPGSEPDKDEIIRLMEYSSSSLLGIVNDILENAQIEAGKINIENEKTEIKTLVNTVCDLVRPLAFEKGLNLTCNIDEDAPAMIMADSLRLNQILINLINNSIKFTNSGSVNVTLKHVENKDGKSLIEFIIADTGIGISDSEIDNIFNRFEQANDKTWQQFGGTGLGLSIVKRLIELMGGQINVESKVGEGTTFLFKIWFTVIDPVLVFEDTTSLLTDLPEFNNILALVAEDNPVNQFVIVEILKKWNIQVDVANNGLEAYEMCMNKNYNLILMDIHMPVMSGNEATRKIRDDLNGIKQEIPIIAYSASVIDKDRKAARIAGVNDFIDKPIEPQLLHQKISNLINTGFRPVLN